MESAESKSVPVAAAESKLDAAASVRGPIRRQRATRARGWCYTVFYEPADEESLLLSLASIDCSYHVFGIEVCPTTGRKHIQGYIEYDTQLSMSNAKSRIHPSAHLEKRRGTPQQASDYCKKEGNFQEVGELSKGQGARNDLSSALAAIRANPNATRQSICESHTTVFAKYPKFVDTVFGFYRPTEVLNWTDSPNKFIFGEAGVGKSKMVREDHPNLYIKQHNKWWDGYDGEECALIDDLHPDNAKYLVTHIKQWADRYPFRAEIKGSSMVIRPKVIVITSNYSIEEMFPNVPDQKAIRRRFHVTHMQPPLM